MMSFDTERLIIEIQARKALWDMSCEEYANRDLKRTLWEEVTEIFSSSELTGNEKKELCTSLQKKWKNIRDAFLRELRRIKGAKSGAAATRKSPYTFFNQLLFLKPTVQVNTTESNLDETESRVNDPIPESVISRSKKKKASDSLEREDLVSVLKESINYRNERESRNEDDSDRMFLLSLLPHFSQIPESGKMAAKIEMMNVIQRATSGRNGSSNVEPMSRETQPAYPRTRYPSRSYQREYQQDHCIQSLDSGRQSTISFQPSMSRPNEPNQFYSETEHHSIRSPESNYSVSSQYSEVIDTFMDT